MKIFIIMFVLTPQLLIAQRTHDFGIQLSFNPSLSKTSTTNFDKVGQGLNRPLFAENGAKFPTATYAYGLGVFYYVSAKDRLEINYASMKMGQRSGRQFFVNNQERYGYLLQLERLTNQLSLIYTHLRSTSYPRNLKYYWSAGVLANSTNKYVEQFFNWPDEGLDHQPSSSRYASTYKQYAMIRLGFGIGGGLSYEWFKGVVFSSGIRYGWLSDVVFYFDGNTPRGMANLLEWENKLAVSIFK